MTTEGQLMLAGCVVFLGAAIWLGRGVSRRSSPGEKTSKIVVLILFMMIALFVPFTLLTGQALYELATKPVYDATVVGHTSEYRDVKDSKGRVTGQREVHIARVQFVGPGGETLVLSNSVASGGEPVPGSVMKVVYAPGDAGATELSLRSLALWLMACVMLSILGYILWAAVWYALGHPMAGVQAFGAAAFFRVFLPAITSMMMLALGYTAFKYFVLGNPDELPLWAAGLCTLFTLALLPLLVMLLKPMLGRSTQA